MIDDAFVKAFLEEGPDQPGPAPEVEDKPMYTRAEVDKIVQDTIDSTMAALRGETTAEENQLETVEENEKTEVNENGKNEQCDTGETE